MWVIVRGRLWSSLPHRDILTVLKKISGKKLVEIEAAEFGRLLGLYDSVLIDIGTGDGKFVLTQARENSRMLCVGVEPAWERVSQASNRAVRKPAKGGAPNALFLCASAENLPVELRNVADLVTVNYPWGSLLSGICLARENVISNLAGLGRAGAKLVINLNTAVFEDPLEREKLGLPDVNTDYVRTVMQEQFRRLGWRFATAEFLSGQLPVSTTWGAQLVKGSMRNTLNIGFVLEN